MRQVMQPGEIVLPTPFIRRARGQQLTSPVQQPAFKDRASNVSTGQPDCVISYADMYRPGVSGSVRPPSLVSALEIEMLPLRSRISSARFTLYESILRALHALLVATKAPTTTKSFSTNRPPTSRSSKSLVSLCLRKVPDYIGELEYWEQREAKEKGTKSTLQTSDVSSQVYGALEDMLPASRGCLHLRAVVREHGMKFVRDAMVEGLLDDSFSHLLSTLCFRLDACLEAEGLLNIILDRPYPKPKNVDSTFDESRRLAPLKTLRDFARWSDRPRFMLRQLSKLLMSQQLPYEWLSTKEFASIWSGVVKTLSGDAECDDTVAFAVLFIASLSSQAKISAFTLRPERGNLKSLSQQTLLSAITALVSVTLLRQEAKQLSTKQTACSISRRIGYTIAACNNEMRKGRKPGWISTILNLAAHFTSISQTGRSGPTVDISELWHRVLQDRNRKDGKQHYEAATALISSLASCCARGAAKPSHHYITKFFHRLDSDAAVEESKSWKLRVDCAFSLAERTNDMRDLAFAESLSNASRPGSSSANSTPRKASTSSCHTGFRWDGDISEWVTATPVPPQGSRRTSNKESCQDETDDNDSYVSDAGSSSAEHCNAHILSPRRSTRSSTERRFTQSKEQNSASPPRVRKRSVTLAGLLSSDGEETSEEDEIPRCRRSRRQSQHQIRGQENEAGLLVVSAYAGPKKRRRVAADMAVTDRVPLKPRRAILRTITNTGHGDMSDDELGL